jgi:hypothetical protein
MPHGFEKACDRVWLAHDRLSDGFIQRGPRRASEENAQQDGWPRQIEYQAESQRREAGQAEQEPLQQDARQVFP